jgi:uncharacterized membrane protein YqjE
VETPLNRPGTPVSVSPAEIEVPPIDVQAILLAESPADPQEASEIVVVPETPVQIATEDLGGVAVDAVKLFELQLQLFHTELKQNLDRLIQPVLLLTAGGATAMAAFVVLFHALGWALHDLLGWPVSVSLLIIVILGAVASWVTVQAARNKLRLSRISFAKSKEELTRNIGCFASFLRSPKK